MGHPPWLIDLSRVFVNRDGNSWVALCGKRDDQSAGCGNQENEGRPSNAAEESLHHLIGSKVPPAHAGHSTLYV